MANTRARAKQVTYKSDATGGVVRNLHDKLSDTVSVKDFGAVGDGVTDDTAAIQAADIAAALVRTRLLFPTGIYKVTDSIEFTSEIEMFDGAVLSCTDSTKYFKFTRGFKAGLNPCIDTDAPTMFIGIEAIYPQWFGDCGLTAQDSSIALTRAFKAARAGMNGINKTTDASFGCVHVHLIRGNYRCNNVDVYNQTILTGEVTGAINNSIITQIDRTIPALRVHPKNYSLTTGGVTNDSNGINTFERVCFRSETINDTVANSPVIKFYSPAQSATLFGVAGDTAGGDVGHIDTTFENCWFQFTAGAGIGVDEGALDFQMMDCTFDVCRSGVEYSGTARGALRATNVHFFECVRRGFYAESSSSIDAKFDNCWFNGCGNPLNTEAKYRRSIYFDRGAVTDSKLFINDCRFKTLDDSGTKFGGPIRFRGQHFEMSDCYLEDLDTSDLQKFALLQCDEIKMVDNILKTTVLNSYANSRIISLSQTPQPSMIKMCGNIFWNTSGSSVDNFIHSDFVIDDMDFSGNTFKGNVNTAINSNIADRVNHLYDNIGYGPTVTWRSSVPLAGTWKVGDVTYNTAPIAGGTVGWVCVTAGTPGTWKSFGTIAV